MGQYFVENCICCSSSSSSSSSSSIDTVCCESPLPSILFFTFSDGSLNGELAYSEITLNPLIPNAWQSGPVLRTNCEGVYYCMFFQCDPELGFILFIQCGTDPDSLCSGSFDSPVVFTTYSCVPIEVTFDHPVRGDCLQCDQTVIITVTE